MIIRILHFVIWYSLYLSSEEVIQHHQKKVIQREIQ